MGLVGRLLAARGAESGCDDFTWSRQWQQNRVLTRHPLWEHPWTCIREWKGTPSGTAHCPGGGPTVARAWETPMAGAVQPRRGQGQHVHQTLGLNGLLSIGYPIEAGYVPGHCPLMQGSWPTHRPDWAKAAKAVLRHFHNAVVHRSPASPHYMAAPKADSLTGLEPQPLHRDHARSRSSRSKGDQRKRTGTKGKRSGPRPYLTICSSPAVFASVGWPPTSCSIWKALTASRCFCST